MSPSLAQAIEPVWFNGAGCSVCLGPRIYNDFESLTRVTDMDLAVVSLITVSVKSARICGRFQESD